MMLDVPTNVDLQYQLEAQQQELGRARFLRDQERIGNDLGYGSREDTSKLIKGCLGSVAEVLRSSTGTMTAPRFYLSLLDTDLLALIALSEAFDSIHKKPSLNSVTVRMGRAVEAEVWAKALKEEDKKLYERLVLRATRTHGSLVHRKKAIRATAKKEGYHPVAWAEEVRSVTGGILLNAVLEGCPELFETYIHNPTMEACNTPLHLGLTEAGSDLLSQITDTLSWMSPVFKPMVTPPKPWTAFDNGGYLSHEMNQRVNLVRSFDEDNIKLIKKAIKDGSMDLCLEAVNTIQETAWAINTPLLDLVKWAWTTNQPITGFPSSKHLPKPTQPPDWEELNDSQRKAWRIKATQVATRNRGIDGDRVTMLQDLSVAQSLVGHERFYLPHSLDFRGRVYPVPAFNGQRADHIRALFQFAEGKPIGDSGAYWLAIHLANAGDYGGVSKRPLSERFEWTVDNEPLIRRVAGDPYGTVGEWSQADKPFQFVAACIEYAGYLELGESYVSHLPIALDGSNSGLQHYSASLRSLEGAYVNLTPQDKPADLYQAVADLVVAEVLRDVAQGNPVAQVVHKNGVSRKLVKRNAMTFSYSSGEYGFKQQHMEDLMRPLGLKVLSGELEEHPYGEDGGYQAAGYIAKKTHAAITGLVKDAVSGMRFFQKCAAALAHEGKGLTWVTPMGLPVTHRYLEWDQKRVQLFLHDKSIPVIKSQIEESIDTASESATNRTKSLREVRLLIRSKPSTRINKTKAKSAISPNVIHSMDASHLMLTVLRAKENGIGNFSLIHDSFGTHAADTSEFFYIIREAFIELYENYCPYETIREAALSTIDDKSKAPLIPQKGSLDVNEIYNSLYAFV
jgi:DNA-directed RNA polymerase